jgi:hypothetical protein
MAHFFSSMSPAGPPPAKVKVSEIGAIHSGSAKRGRQVVRKAAERDRTFSHYVKPPTAVRDAGGKLQTAQFHGNFTHSPYGRIRLERNQFEHWRRATTPYRSEGGREGRGLR